MIQIQMGEEMIKEEVLQVQMEEEMIQVQMGEEVLLVLKDIDFYKKRLHRYEWCIGLFIEEVLI